MRLLPIGCRACESMYRTVFEPIGSGTLRMERRDQIYLDDWATMEVAWAGPEGAASDSELPALADLAHNLVCGR
jgi:hypothetical protein